MALAKSFGNCRVFSRRWRATLNIGHETQDYGSLIR